MRRTSTEIQADAQYCAILLTEENLAAHDAPILLASVGLIHRVSTVSLVETLNESMLRLCEMHRIMRALDTLNRELDYYRVARVLQRHYVEYWARYGVHIPAFWGPRRGIVYRFVAIPSALLNPHTAAKASQ